jgi:DinB family protein
LTHPRGSVLDMDPKITMLVSLVDQAFKGPAWHGTPLWGSVRGVTAEEALRRPGPGRHNVWELVLHAAYWKCIVRRRLTGDASIDFPRSPSDWPETGGIPDAARWKADRALLKREHELLRAVVARFPARELTKKSRKSQWTNYQQIEGIGSHDLYHCGQIQLVKKLTG